MPSIDKKTIEHLAELARIKVRPEEEQRLLKDLENILKHFEELRELDIKNTGSVVNTTLAKNVFRDDGSYQNLDCVSTVQAFPDDENGFLKVPPVFE